jgi:hypothetical protein
MDEEAEAAYGPLVGWERCGCHGPPTAVTGCGDIVRARPRNQTEARRITSRALSTPPDAAVPRPGSWEARGPGGRRCRRRTRRRSATSRPRTGRRTALGPCSCSRHRRGRGMPREEASCAWSHELLQIRLDLSRRHRRLAYTKAPALDAAITHGNQSTAPVVHFTCTVLLSLSLLRPAGW